MSDQKASSLGSTSAVYKPSQWGYNYHYVEGVDELFGAGSAGPGKTTVLCMDWLQQAIVEHMRCEGKYPGFELEWGKSNGHALYLRRLVKSTSQTLSRVWNVVSQIDSGARVVKGETIEMSSGYKWTVGHCQHLMDWQQYQSLEFDHIAFDELPEFEEEQYSQIGSRLRSSDIILSKMRKIRAMGNPRATSWVKDMFVKPYPAGNKILQLPQYHRDGTFSHYLTRMYMPATIDDNPNKEFVEQYKRTLLGKPKHIRDALLYGSWDVTAHAFFADSWNPDIHVCNPFDVPVDWPMFRSMDWGYKSPGAVHWYAFAPAGTLFVVRELMFQGMFDRDVADKIIEVEKRMGLVKKGRSILGGPADNQLWEERGEFNQKTKAETFLERGVWWVKADKRSRKRNAELLLERLNSHDGGTSIPGIVFMRDRCPNIVKNLPGFETSEKDPECPADGGDDHSLDSLLYGCAYAARGPAVGVARKKEESWQERFEEEHGVVFQDAERRDGPYAGRCDGY